ncbi:MAG: N-acetylmuramoyl-L-alanine amidase [Defluviitaleaceae bacterium]|nr:N-acetylmuramoyl-L-alanine amidase [Defluviitaleaceae bacterium]
MKFFSVKKETVLAVIYLAAIGLGLFFAVRGRVVPAFSMPLSKKVVLIDAGHGGFDPGKVSDPSQEKDINLAISQKLQSYLELGDSTVFMTRVDDAGLSATKKGDMYSRKLIANTSKADIFVSVHQNSYTSYSVHGAQVFYFNSSDDSKKLAQCIQDKIKEFVEPDNTRQPKENSSYYVLKQTTMPAVIVECGFLSNPSDKQKLIDPDYQDRLAWAIYMGIVEYFQSSGGE